MPVNGSDVDNAEQAVIVCVKLSGDEFGTFDEREALFDFEEDLQRTVAERSAGEFDGNEASDGFCRIYYYGPSADALCDVVLQVVQADPLPPGSYLIKRYGAPGSEEIRVKLSPETREQ